MKIVHIQQFFNAGLGYQENILPAYQQKLGHEVVVLTSTRTDGFNQSERIKPEGEFLENGFLVRRLAIRGDLPHKFVLFKNLMAALEQEQPDYIFHHGCAAPSIGTACAYKKAHPAVFLALDNHSDRTISIGNPLLRFLYYRVIWRHYLAAHRKQIDLYFGVTPGRCLFLEEEYGVPADKIRLLPLGADHDRIDIRSSRRDFWSRFGVDPDKLILIHGGKMTAHKQIDRILIAFSRLKSASVQLVLFGSLDDETLKALAAQDPRIHFIGWLNREDTLEALRHSDTGIWNTQHTTLLEDSVAVGLPLILRYYGATCHLIDGSGLFLYSDSIRELHEKIQLLVDQPALLVALKQQASQHSKALAYETIARESVAYAAHSAAQPTHIRFMDPRFSDPRDPSFRSIH